MSQNRQTENTIMPPIVLIAYKRGEKLGALLSELTKQTERPQQIIAYIDAPESEIVRDAVNQCIQTLENFTAIPRQINIRERHMGCRQNIIDAITEVFNQYPTAIILEEDISIAPDFYATMFALLTRYEHENTIFSVSGYTGHNMPEAVWESISDDYFVSNRFQCWGWGTWANRWQSTLQRLKKNDIPYRSFLEYPVTPLTRTLFADYFWYRSGLGNTWAIPLAIITLGLGYGHISPKYAFIQNIGFDDPMATHTGHSDTSVNKHYNANKNRDKYPERLNTYAPLAKQKTGFSLATYWLKWTPWYISVLILGLLGKKRSQKIHSMYRKLRESSLQGLIPKWHD